MRFLFWNTKKSGNVHAIADVIRSELVDIAALVEPPDVDGLVRHASRGEDAYRSYPLRCSRIAIIGKLPHDFIHPINEGALHSIVRLSDPILGQFLLAMGHMPSQLHHSRDSVGSAVREFACEIRGAEREHGIDKTIVVGDFNLNPFDVPLIETTGMHAVSSRIIARELLRRVNARDYAFFYNPMWACLGDKHDNIPGTYFYRSATHDCMFWNVFDQVMIRPCLINLWKDEHFRVITSTVARSLLDESRRPDDRYISDHLPIVFQLGE